MHEELNFVIQNIYHIAKVSIVIKYYSYIIAKVGEYKCYWITVTSLNLLISTKSYLIIYLIYKWYL